MEADKLEKTVKHLVLEFMVVSILCTSVSALESSNAYISSGGAYIHRWGPGDISVKFHVVGTDIMDTIGAHRVTVYGRSGETPDSATDEIIVTYWYKDYPDMMTTDEFAFGHSIRLRVAAGQKYYAVLIFYATLDGRGVDMGFSTTPVGA